MFHPSGKWNSPVARIDNGQEHCHEERNRSFEKPSESDHQTLPHSPNESSHVIETQSDECTPVIVQCYSLSTVSPILEPTSMSDSAHFMITQKTDASVNIGNGDPPVPVSHSRCLYQQHSSKSHKSASYLQGNEDVLYNCPTAGPRSSTNPHNHKFVTQPRHAMDESSTPELAVDDEQNQTHSTTLPGQFHKRCTIPPSFPCLNCQPGQRTFKNGYDVNCTQTSRRDHHPYNNQWSEPHRNASHNVSGQGVIHVPNDYPRTRSAVDMRDGRADSHTPGETFRNWHTRQVPRESRPALKIHDYYEERRILVGKVYQDIPGSVETESNQNSAIPYAHAREEYQKDHHQNGATSAEVFQAPAGEEGALQICVHQSKIAVGSKKRKSRQPRPQRVKTNDPALERETYQHQIQYAEDCQEEFSHNSYHQNALTSKETFRNRSEDAGVRVNESEMYSYEPVHEPTDPVQPESGTRREDHAFENNSSRPEFCRKETPPETHSPWRIQFHDKGSIKSQLRGVIHCLSTHESRVMFHLMDLLAGTTVFRVNIKRIHIANLRRRTSLWHIPMEMSQSVPLTPAQRGIQRISIGMVPYGREIQKNTLKL
ncbi:hypothetical protein OS493_009812 [Desmophyllum pertusum]|uniref:Uncharacterized protein n=1 Tax=Desmophyllum pertusum TaxID=174260 RepID=A0A9W9YRI4_9CNID|nr:hypothetical protein OS493_009812 [Desmophyllum pertusum]